MDIRKRLEIIQTQNGQLSSGIVEEIVKAIRDWLTEETSKEGVVWIEYNFVIKLLEKLEK